MKKYLFFIIICGILLITIPLVVKGKGEVMYPDPLQGKEIIDIINGIIDMVVTIGIGVGMIMIIVSAIQYMTAGGSEEKVTKAKKALMWTVIGIAILLSARLIIQLIEEILKG